MSLLIKNGVVLDPSADQAIRRDVYIDRGVIQDQIPDSEQSNSIQVLDAAGCWVMPGFIDLHVHLREPGLTHKETIATGSAAAAAGGFTTICAMPNTVPVTDSAEIVRYILGQAAKAPYTHVLPVGSITFGQEGRELSHMDEMAAAGVCAFSEDGKSVMNAALMKQAMEKAKALGIPILDHCEDISLAGGCVNEGENAQRAGLPGISRDAEELMTARDIMLAASTGVKLHICHVSTAGSVEIIREAKKRGIPITAEACPHHFTLSDESILTQDPNFKMSPPLRTKGDVQAILDGLADGTLDCIATDHAPHHAEDKNTDMQSAANGIVGLETALSLSVTRLTSPGILTPLALAKCLSYNPAKIIGLDRGEIRPHKPADVVIVNPAKQYVVDKNSFYTKGRNTPFHGMTLQGKVEATILDGRIVYQNGKVYK